MTDSFNLDDFLKKAEDVVNPGISTVSRIVSDPGDAGFPDVNKEAYIKEPPRKEVELDDEFAFEGDRVTPEELEEALEVLTDPGYERDIMRFYAKLVNYNVSLCQPIMQKDTLTLSNIQMLSNPIEVFVQRKQIKLLQEQVKLLREIRDFFKESKDEYESKVSKS